ncbi:unnamed protein product [Camellia sinensis]
MGSDKAMKQSPSNTPLEASDSSPKSPDEGSSRGNSKPLPFEFRAFEICLESACRGLESKAMCRDSCIVPGAAATEIELARRLKEFSFNVLLHFGVG